MDLGARKQQDYLFAGLYPTHGLAGGHGEPTLPVAANIPVKHSLMHRGLLPLWCKETVMSISIIR